VTLDVLIEDLVNRGEAVTLDAIGGPGILTDDVASSPLFPYVANAIVDTWDELSQPDRATAAALISDAIATKLGGLALGDTCLAVVPEAPRLEMTVGVKDALRVRISDRIDQQSGSKAAIALRWLAHLAAISEEARPALFDVLTGVARGIEPMPFSVGAAQVAGLAYDHWRDDNARACIERLVDSDGEADAWFALGQARLVDALEEGDAGSCVASLRATIECFDNAANTGEQRPDAVMYAHAVRFLTGWMSDATADMLASDYGGAHSALHQYIVGGWGLADQPMWIRPRFEAETAWIELVRLMHGAVEARPSGQSWYQPAVAISAMADVYRAANSFRPRRTCGEVTASAFPFLLAPTVTAPFIDNDERVAFVELWLRNSDDPDADDFASLVRERSERVVPPKRQPPGATRRSPI